MAVSSTLLRTPFHDFHVAQGGRMVEFAGWEMPMLYRSIIEEHRQVRASGGLFDVSHMGRLRFIGPDAARFLDRVCTRAVQSMTEGQCRYTLICNEQGGCRDDTLVYCLGSETFLMVCNAANRTKLIEHFEALHGDERFEMTDETLESGMLAVQGPKVIGLLGAFLPQVAALKRYRFAQVNLLGIGVLVSRTGYTGEDGVEVILPAAAAAQAIALVQGSLGAGGVVQPAGLGARDTLRLEAGMPLYGHEITEDRDPLAAGLTFAVKLDKAFVGQQALQRIAAERPRRRLVGLRLAGRRTARAAMRVTKDGAEVGEVTSACLSPTLEAPIAMAYLDRAHAEPGGQVEVDLGRARAGAEVVKLPFYKPG